MWSASSLPLRAWRGYLSLLSRRPLTTKCVTSGAIMLAGDAIQQGIEHRARQQEHEQAAAAAATTVAYAAAAPVPAAPASGCSADGSCPLPPRASRSSAAAAPLPPPSFLSSYDVPRSVRSGLFGALAVGPIFHVWFNRLDRWIPGGGVRAVAGKLVLDQALMAPLFTVFYFATMGVMEGRSREQIWQKIRVATGPTLLANYAIFPAAQAANFAFVPERLRVLVLNAGGLVYNVVLSKYNAQALAEDAVHHQPHASAMALPVATATPLAAAVAAAPAHSGTPAASAAARQEAQRERPQR